MRDIVTKFRRHEQMRLMQARDAHPQLGNVIDTVTAALNEENGDSKHPWEAFAEKAYALLVPLGLAYDIEMPALHWRLRNSHDSVNSTFGDGVPLSKAVDDICAGKLQPADFPPIYAVAYDNVYWCLCNRRCWRLKRSQERLGQEVLVPLRILPANIMPDKFISAWTALRANEALGVRAPGLHCVPRRPHRRAHVHQALSCGCAQPRTARPGARRHAASATHDGSPRTPTPLSLRPGPYELASSSSDTTRNSRRTRSLDPEDPLLDAIESLLHPSPSASRNRGPCSLVRCFVCPPPRACSVRNAYDNRGNVPLFSTTATRRKRQRRGVSEQLPGAVGIALLTDVTAPSVACHGPWRVARVAGGNRPRTVAFLLQCATVCDARRHDHAPR